MIWAYQFSILFYEIVILFKAFTSYTIFSFILTLINISFIKTFLQHFLYYIFMSCFSGSYKICIIKVKMIPDSFMFNGHRVEIIHNIKSCFLSFYNGFLTILIDTRGKSWILPWNLIIFVYCICNETTIKMSHMRNTISIINRCRNIEFLLCHFSRNNPIPPPILFGVLPFD